MLVAFWAAIAHALGRGKRRPAKWLLTSMPCGAAPLLLLLPLGPLGADMLATIAAPPAPGTGRQQHSSPGPQPKPQRPTAATASLGVAGRVEEGITDVAPARRTESIGKTFDRTARFVEIDANNPVHRDEKGAGPYLPVATRC